jgi:pimeloyl-ACP methyl ester carboxylesterase
MPRIDMEAQARTGTHSTVAGRTLISTNSVTSADGTTIGYRRVGQGPGVVLVHGTMSSGQNHTQLAEALADVFTVIVPDRRGRGLSGPYRGDERIQSEVEDLGAVLAATGAHRVFGVSSGAIILLQAALTLPAIQKAAVFEPPLFDDAALPAALSTRFDAEIAQGRLAEALVTAMKGAQMGPAAFGILPRWLLVRLTGRFMKSQDGHTSGDYVPMRALAPTMRYDFRLVAEMSGKFESFRAIQAETLLLGGSKSPAYLKAALGRLATVLPEARRVELPGVDHAASWNSDVGGKPERVAEELRRFFA